MMVRWWSSPEMYLRCLRGLVDISDKGVKYKMHQNVCVLRGWIQSDPQTCRVFCFGLKQLLIRCVCFRTPASYVISFVWRSCNIRGVYSRNMRTPRCRIPLQLEDPCRAKKTCRLLLRFAHLQQVGLHYLIS